MYTSASSLPPEYSAHSSGAPHGDIVRGAAATDDKIWRERILLVEDDGDLQRMLSFTLARLGYEVQAAGSGQQALQMWQEATPETRAQLVLTDVQMPGFDGIELLRRIRADDADLPVIVMTAFTSHTAIIEALRLHADDFVAKPIEIAELRTALDRALRARRQRAALDIERTTAARLQAVLDTATAVNHEINNPLAAISASAQLMRQLVSSSDSSTRKQPDVASPATTTDELDTAALSRMIDVILDQCERIADFNRRLSGVVKPVTRSAGGQRMLDVDHSR